jgi:hypothetical protein
MILDKYQTSAIIPFRVAGLGDRILRGRDVPKQFSATDGTE